MTRRWLVGPGAAAAGAGLVLTLRPGLAATLALDRRVIVALGAVGLLAGLWVAAARRGLEPDRTPTGEPETRVALPAPGDGLGEDLRLAAYPANDSARRRVRGRLREAAIAVVRRRRGCSAERAAAIVDAGEWTEDPYAAAFVSDALDPPRRLLAPVRAFREPPFHEQVRRTVAAVAATAEMEVDA